MLLSTASCSPKVLFEDVGKQSMRLSLWCGCIRTGLARKVYPILSSLQQFLVAVFVAAACGAGTFFGWAGADQIRSPTSARTI
ncbi:hypothetical protein [Ensifer canadensis]|uniref:hypothetical protein n=1 Tax=Ensifer canadensis TaxID=555315 RepID=UPI0035E3DDF0